MLFAKTAKKSKGRLLYMRPFAVITGPVISSGFDQHQRGATIKNNRKNFTLCVKLGGGGQQNLVCEPRKLGEGGSGSQLFSELQSVKFLRLFFMVAPQSQWSYFLGPKNHLLTS